MLTFLSFFFFIKFSPFLIIKVCVCINKFRLLPPQIILYTRMAHKNISRASRGELLHPRRTERQTCNHSGETTPIFAVQNNGNVVAMNAEHTRLTCHRN